MCPAVLSTGRLPLIFRSVHLGDVNCYRPMDPASVWWTVGLETRRAALRSDGPGPLCARFEDPIANFQITSDCFPRDGKQCLPAAAVAVR